jgi:hypothetical protein
MSGASITGFDDPLTLAVVPQQVPFVVGQFAHVEYRHPTTVSMLTKQFQFRLRFRGTKQIPLCFRQPAFAADQILIGEYDASSRDVPRVDDTSRKASSCVVTYRQDDVVEIVALYRLTLSRPPPNKRRLRTKRARARCSPHVTGVGHHGTTHRS